MQLGPTFYLNTLILKLAKDYRKIFVNVSQPKYLDKKYNDRAVISIIRRLRIYIFYMEIRIHDRIYQHTELILILTGIIIEHGHYLPAKFDLIS